MSLSAGELRERIAIQSSTPSPDGAGGTERAWSDVTGLLWAKVEPLNGGEAFRQGMANNTQFYRVTFRYRPDVTPRHRIWWRDQALNIRTCADPDNRRERLVMTVESGAPE